MPTPIMNHTVIMSDALHFSADQEINPYYHDHNINRDHALHEHDKLREAFEAAGIDIIATSSPTDSQDGVYTANWGLIRDDTAVLARLPNVRRSEEAHAEKIFRSLGKKVLHVPEDWSFSGQGDALPCGNLLFCGQGYRSDVRAQEFAAKELGYDRIQLQTLPELTNGQPCVNPVSGWADSFYYDIDLALSVLRPPTLDNKGLIAYCPAAFTPESRDFLEDFDLVDKITIDEDEATGAFAANLVSTGETVIMNANAPKLREKIIQSGLAVTAMNFVELAKGGGNARCMSLAIN